MQLLYRFAFRRIGDTYLGSVEQAHTSHPFNGILQLNEVGCFIVKELQSIFAEDNKDAQPISLSAPISERQDAPEEQTYIESLSARLMEEYEVDSDTARKSVTEVLTYLKQEGVLI